MNRNCFKDIDYHFVRNSDKSLDIFFADGNDTKFKVFTLPWDEHLLAMERGDLSIGGHIKEVFKYALGSRNFKLPSQDVYIVETYTDYQCNSTRDYFFDLDVAKAFEDMVDRDWFGDGYSYNYSINLVKLNLETGKESSLWVS